MCPGKGEDRGGEPRFSPVGADRLIPLEAAALLAVWLGLALVVWVCLLIELERALAGAIDTRWGDWGLGMRLW